MGGTMRVLMMTGCLWRQKPSLLATCRVVTMTTARGVSALVTPGWLRERLGEGQKNLRVLDASWTPLKSGQDDFLERHIPSAHFLDLNHCVQPKPTLARNLPEPACFSEYLQSLGVSTDSHVVFYDRGGMVPSARAWWTCRAYGLTAASVLDGGLRHWETSGYDVESGPSDPPQKGDFNVRIDESLITSFSGMMKLLADRSAQIVDGRKPENFFGEEPEPTPSTIKALEGMRQPIPKALHRGHVPGAVNILDCLVVDPDTKCLLPRDKLIRIFRDFGVDMAKPLVTMCYNGNVASLLALATHVCGKTDTSVYYGSWTEYGQRADPNMVQGPAKTRSGGS